MADLIQAGYLISSVLCISKYLTAELTVAISDEIIGSISGLASQQTARRGNVLGILGVVSGLLASLLAVGFSEETLVQFAAMAGVGSVLGMRHQRSISVILLTLL